MRASFDYGGDERHDRREAAARCTPFRFMARDDALFLKQHA